MQTLPKITKKELKKVGIEIDEERAEHWIAHGHLQLQAYLTRVAMFQEEER